MKTKNICGQLLAAAATLFLISTSVQAQDDDSGPITWGEDAVYVTVMHVDFKPGKRARGMEIIDEYFAPANEKSGTSGPMLVIHYQTGKWDLMAVWEYEGGMADMEWYRSEDDIKWYAAFAEIAGGEEEAAAIMAEFNASIASSVREIGHHHTGEE